MVNNDKKSVIEKIKKLMKLANPTRGGTAEEIDTALAMATKLMKTYNITMAEATKDEPEIVLNHAEAKTPKWMWRWEISLARVFTILCDTDYWVKNFFSGAHKVVFFGVPQDVALSIEMYEIFRKQIRKNAFKSYSYDSGRRSYGEGFVDSLLTKAKEIVRQRQTEEEAPGSQALVFVGRKKDAIKKRVQEMKMGKMRSVNNHVDLGAYSHGKADGRKADLGTSRRLR